MKVLVISGGSIEDAFAVSYINQYQPDKIIAADRGLSFCERYKLIPDYIVGDFDSGSSELAEKFHVEHGVPVDTYNSEKDFTDTDIALKKAIAIGATEVIFLGATGTRLDHTLSNIYNLILLQEQGIDGWLVDAHNRIRIYCSGQRIESTKESSLQSEKECLSTYVQAYMQESTNRESSENARNKILLRKCEQFGENISLFPFRGEIKGLTLKGFYYPLENATLTVGDGGLCVSNYIVDEIAEITWESGELIVMETRD